MKIEQVTVTLGRTLSKNYQSGKIELSMTAVVEPGENYDEIQEHLKDYLSAEIDRESRKIKNSL